MANSATTATVTTSVTESQSVLLKAFIDQVSAYKYNNSTKKVNSISLTYSATDGNYTIIVDEELNVPPTK